MLADDIVRMANQIATFWAPYPHDEALDNIRDHIEKFWDPRMRQLLADIEATPPHTLHPLVVSVVVHLRRSATS
jgi:formate dehydrogenase subunit delta